MEAWTADGRRRSDVRFTFVNGRVVAVELQYGRLTDGDWIDRHSDYPNLGITDVWLWHPRADATGIVHEHRCPDGSTARTATTCTP